MEIRELSGADRSDAVEVGWSRVDVAVTRVVAAWGVARLALLVRVVSLEGELAEGNDDGI